MRNRIRRAFLGIAILGSLALLPMFAPLALTGERPVRPLIAREMRGAVGLQTNYYCTPPVNMCSGGTTGGTCQNGCIQCTEQPTDGRICTIFMGATCTSLPSVRCGEETTGVCVPDDCGGSCTMSPIVTGDCGNTVSQCQ